MTFLADTLAASTGGADENDAAGGRLVVARTLTSRNERIDGETETFVVGAYRKAQKAHDPDDCERWEPTDRTDTLDAGGQAALNATAVLETPVAFHQTQEPIVGDDVSPALGATSIGMGVMTGAAPIAVRGRADGQEWEVGDGAVYNALRASDGGSSRANWTLAGTAVRRLTPTECERLQGFPDGWTAGQADSHRYRQLGNAVAVPVAEWVGRRMAAVDRDVRP